MLLSQAKPSLALLTQSEIHVSHDGGLEGTSIIGVNKGPAGNQEREINTRNIDRSKTAIETAIETGAEAKTSTETMKERGGKTQGKDRK